VKVLRCETNNSVVECMVIKIGRQSTVLFLFLCSPIRKYTSMFHVERELTVRSGTNNTVQPALSLSLSLWLPFTPEEKSYLSFRQCQIAKILMPCIMSLFFFFTRKVMIGSIWWKYHIFSHMIIF